MIDWYIGKRCNFACSYCADFIHDNYYFWRGCPEYDDNFKSYQFSLEGSEGEKTFILKESKNSL